MVDCMDCVWEEEGGVLCSIVCVFAVREGMCVCVLPESVDRGE